MQTYLELRQLTSASTDLSFFLCVCSYTRKAEEISNIAEANRFLCPGPPEEKVVLSERTLRLMAAAKTEELKVIYAVSEVLLRLEVCKI